MAVVVDGCHYLGIVGYFYGQRCASVKGFFGSQHALASVLEAGQLQSVLVGLCSAVDKKQLIVVITARLAQPVCQFLLLVVDDRVAIKGQKAHLPGHHLNVVWVTMPYTYHRMSAVKVEICLAFIIPHGAVFALYDVYVKERINVK